MVPPRPLNPPPHWLESRESIAFKIVLSAYAAEYFRLSGRFLWLRVPLKEVH